MRQLFSIIAAFICVAAFAQKPNLNKAKAAFDKGEYVEAKTIIDQAIDYEKTKDKAKTWYYRGMIYVALDTALNEPNTVEVAMSSFKKALEIDPEQKSISEFTGTGIENVDSRIQGYFGYYYNRAIENYTAENFTQAASDFEQSYVIVSDTNAVINAGYAASAAGDDARAKTNYVKAIEGGAQDKGLFLRLYNFAIQEEDLDGALAVLKDAREIHAADVELQKYEINILIQQDKIDEAKAGIEDAITKEPENPDLLFSLGVIQEESGDFDGAKTSYMKAIEIDENHFNSNFNLGVMVFNKSNDLIKQRNDLGYRETKKYDELTLEINEQLQTALPYWEKLYSMKGEDETVLETLKYIYVNLKMNDKAEEVADKLDAMKG